MSDYDDYWDEESQAAEPGQQKNDYSSEVYKKWFRFGEKQGFLSIKPWLEAGKFLIDIGEINSGNLVSTPSYQDAVRLSVMLDITADGRFGETYGDDGYIAYGGGMVKGEPVSRVFKVTHWVTNGKVDLTAFAFKNGLFEAKKTAQNAFIPDMQKPKSISTIKISLEEVREMAKRVNLSLTNFAAQYPGDIFAALNGEKRE